MNLLPRFRRRLAQVLAMKLPKPVPGDSPQPQKKRLRAITQVLVEALLDIAGHLFEDRRRADTAAQPAIEAQAHHLPQPFAMPREQLHQRLRLVSARLAQEAV